MRVAETKEEDDRAAWFAGDLNTTIMVQCGVCEMEVILYHAYQAIEHCCHCGNELIFPRGAEW